MKNIKFGHVNVSLLARVLALVFKTAVTVIIFGLALSCTSASKKPISGIPIDPAAKMAMESELSAADEILKTGKPQEALISFQSFESKHPVSVFYFRAKIGEARSLEAMSEWSKAIQIYSKILSETRDEFPEIAALALYWSSFCFEAIGDETRALAALTDADQMGKHLSPEKSQAEIPARLAAAYGRMGQWEEAKKYLSRADKGVAGLFGTQKETPENREGRAEVYFLMGNLTTTQLTEENLNSYFETLNLLQVFLLRGAEIDGTVYSSLSQRQLMNQYRDLWKRIESIRAPDGFDPVAAEFSQRQARGRWSARVLESIDRLKLYQSPSDKSALLTELFTYLSQFEVKAKEAIMSSSDLNPLTQQPSKLKE